MLIRRFPENMTGTPKMSSCAEVATPQQKLAVGMGQVVLGAKTDQLTAILGSCIAVAVYHVRTKTAVMAHVVLPMSAGRSGSVGKFADTAVPEMVKRLPQKGIPATTLLAKMAGGACMFGKATGPMQVGDNNAQAVTEALKAANIRLVDQHVGGTKGRRVKFDCQTGNMTIEIAGDRPVTI